MHHARAKTQGQGEGKEKGKGKRRFDKQTEFATALRGCEINLLIVRAVKAKAKRQRGKGKVKGRSKGIFSLPQLKSLA